MFKAESYVGYKLCWPGDLVINSLWAWARGLGVSRYHGIVSSAYGVYRLKPAYVEYSRFIHYLVRSTPFQWELQVRSRGIWLSRLQLTDEAFLGAPFPIPPSREQTAIVRFVDWADRRIRRVMRARRQRIKLLEEYKQALIHQVVTGRIDVRTGQPYPAYKDSGVEWLGQVPTHWEVVNLKSISKRMQNGSTPPTDMLEYYADEGFPWYGPPSFGTRIVIGPPMRFVTEQAITDRKVRVIQPPALAVSVIGNVGKSALMLEPGATNQQITSFELNDQLCDPRFVVNQFRMAEESLVASASSATIAILDSLALQNTPLAFPPLPEQTAIVEYLDAQTAKIDAAIAADRKAIDLLQEFRTRLIADVVTGKLDVREAAANLPDEPEGEEELIMDEGTNEEGKALADAEPGAVTEEAEP